MLHKLYRCIAALRRAMAHVSCVLCAYTLNKWLQQQHRDAHRLHDEDGVWRRGQCYRTYFMIATRAVSCALLLAVAVGEHLVSEAYSRSPANRQPGALSRSALVIAGV